MLTQKKGKNDKHNTDTKENDKDEEHSLSSDSSSCSGEWSMVTEETEQGGIEQKKGVVDDAVNSPSKVDNGDDGGGGNDDSIVAKAITETLSACASAIDSLVVEINKDDDGDGNGKDDGIQQQHGKKDDAGSREVNDNNDATVDNNCGAFSSGRGGCVIIGGDDEETCSSDQYGAEQQQTRGNDNMDNDNGKKEEDENQANSHPVTGVIVIPKKEKDAGGAIVGSEERNDTLEASALTVPSIPTEIESLLDLSTTEKDDIHQIKNDKADNNQAFSLQSATSVANTMKDQTTAEKKLHNRYHKPIVLLLIFTSILAVMSMTVAVYLSIDRNVWRHSVEELQKELERVKAKAKEEEEERKKMQATPLANAKQNETHLDNHDSNNNNEIHSNDTNESIPQFLQDNIFFNTASEKCSASASKHNNDFVVDNCYIKAKISISSGECLDNFKQKSKTMLKRFQNAAQESSASFWNEYQEAYENMATKRAAASSLLATSSVVVRGLFEESVLNMFGGGGRGFANDKSKDQDINKKDKNTKEEEEEEAGCDKTVNDDNTMHTLKPNRNIKTQEEVVQKISSLATEATNMLTSMGKDYFNFLNDENNDATNKNVKGGNVYSSDTKQPPSKNKKAAASSKPNYSTTRSKMTEEELLMEQKFEQVAESIKQGISGIIDLVSDVTIGSNNFDEQIKEKEGEDETKKTPQTFAHEVTKFLNTMGEGYFYFMDEDEDDYDNPIKNIGVNE